MEPAKDRVEWVDTLRFLGILAIYIGHFGPISGKVYPFVFTYHVPLFFFVSGFFTTNLKKSILLYTKEKLLQLMLPYLVFAALAMVYYTLAGNWELPQILDAGKTFVFGIRNQVYAASLWFLPCLFFISVANYIIVKLTKSRFASFAVAAACWELTQSGIMHNPLNQPTWFMNVDSALYYYLYFALGSLLYPLINVRFSSMTVGVKSLSVVIGALSIVVTIVTYQNGNGWCLAQVFAYVPALLEVREAVVSLFHVILALVIIHANILIAKATAHVALLPKLGRETLVFCGTEQVFKDGLVQCLAIVGVTCNLSNSFRVIAYSLLLLMVSYFTVVRLLVTYFPEWVGRGFQVRPQSATIVMESRGVDDRHHAESPIVQHA